MSEEKGLLLSIDCSNRWTCLGLVEQGEPLGEFVLDLKRRQAGQLALAAERFLQTLGRSFHGLSHLAVTVGPGYFTGIRIGMAYCMGLALTLGLKVIPLGALDVLAQSFPQEPKESRAVIALIAASKGSAFSAGWDRQGKKVLDEKERSWEEIQGALRDLDPQAALIAARDPRLFSNHQGLLPILWLSSPGGIAAAQLAWQQRDNAIDPSQLRAQYLKEPGIGNL